MSPYLLANYVLYSDMASDISFLDGGAPARADVYLTTSSILDSNKIPTFLLDMTNAQLTPMCN